MDNLQASPPMYCINVNGTIINTAIDPSILGQFWASLAIQLVPGSDLLGLAGPTFRVLDEGGKHFIAHNFASAIGDSKVKYVIDGSGMHPDRYFLGRASFFRPENVMTYAGDLDVWIPPGYPIVASIFGAQNNSGVQALSNSSRRATRNGAVKVPRPPNAYILYRKDHHKAVKQSNPELSNNEISVILGRQWNYEEDEVRMHYHMMAMEIKRQVEKLHPDYRYNPRKSSEIRRRARGNHGVYTVPNVNGSSGEQDQIMENGSTGTISIPTPSTESSMSPDTLDSGLSNGSSGQALDNPN